MLHIMGKGHFQGYFCSVEIVVYVAFNVKVQSNPTLFKKKKWALLTATTSGTKTFISVPVCPLIS